MEELRVGNPVKRLHVIINPAAGRKGAILGVLNAVWRPAGIDWQVSITHRQGDATRFARQAAQTDVDVVAVYGGDDTVTEAAAALKDFDKPMAILPGGTANVKAMELGIPLDLAGAAALIAGPHLERPIDLGWCGDRLFLVRLSVGFLAEMVTRADREAKDRFGVFAYALAALQALDDPHEARYRIVMDDHTVEMEGVACLVANSGNLGLPGLSLSPRIDVADGLLDVIVLRDMDITTLATFAASAAALEEAAAALPHWQTRQATIHADPAQRVAIDGEPFGSTPVAARALDRAVRIVVSEKAA
jgi:YegS/Rv2252/BmrU family lipid kinase